MPQVYNGCGTWYYGKSNLQTYQGVCDSCRNSTTLSSYDTRLWIVIVMIPVIPLGRKRIIEDCAACRRHRVMKLSDWEALHARATEAVSAYEKSPTDPDKAIQALQATAGFRDLEMFTKLAPIVEANQPGNAKVLLMLAGAHDSFGRIKDTELFLRAALEIEETDEVREALGDCLMSQNRPDDAEPYLRHIVDKGVPDRVNMLYRLAQVYQIKGNHDKAMEYFEHAAAVNPHILQDSLFVKLKAESAKRLGKSAPINPNKIAQDIKTAASTRQFFKVAGVVVVLALIGYLALAAIQGQRRQVFVVNGLKKPYTVKINGQTQLLPALGFVPMRVPEGEVHVEIVDLPDPGPEAVVDVKTNFLNRPFNSQAFVINPDRAGVILQTKGYYVAHGQSAPETEFTFVGGQRFYRFDDIDYPFAEFPETVSMDSHTNMVSKTGLSVYGKATLSVPLAYMIASREKELGIPSVIEIAKHQLLADPDQIEFLNVLQKFAKPEEVIAFVRPLLQKPPVRVEWHRTYQEVMRLTQHDDELETEYQSFSAKDPANPDLMYLLARVTMDRTKATALCTKAVSGPSPSGFAYHWLSYDALENGEFHAAAEYGEKARELLPKGMDLGWYWTAALRADGQYDKAIKWELEAENGPFPNCLVAFENEAYCHWCKGDRAAMADTLARARKRVAGASATVIEQFATLIDANTNYYSGDLKRFIDVYVAEKDPGYRFAGQISAANLEAAEKELDASGTHEGHEGREGHFLLFIAASLKGNREMARRHLTAGIELLRKGRVEDRIFADLFEGKHARPIEEQIRMTSFQPSEKMVVLTALGMHDPSVRKPCFELAGKLNWDKRFPYLLIKQALQTPAP